MAVVFLEDVVLGQEETLGSHRFELAEMIAFAEAYDPQRFHLSEEGARDGLNVAISASGWQTAAIGMKLLVGFLMRRAQEGAPLAVGPSPGFNDMRWRQPVLAGDTLTYRTTPQNVRPLASRPGWGVLSSRMTAHNQAGVLAFEFTSNVLMRMRPTGG
jgi:acyl dehydratase